MEGRWVQLKDYIVYLDKKIGAGAQAPVYEAYKGKTKYAAKCIPNKTAKHLLDNELLVFRKNKTHKNVVSIVDFCEWEEGKSAWIFMEFCKYGSLNDFATNNPEHFSNNRVKLDLMLQISAGLKFLHELKLIHRDIKPSNILLTEEDGLIVVKIADFGVSKQAVGTATQTIVGTIQFLAPEFWPFNENMENMQRKYNEKIDIFALGLTYLAMIQGINDIQALLPKLRGLKKSQESLAIGQLMYMRKVDGDPPLGVVTVEPNDDEFSKVIKTIITECTHVEALERISAEYVHQQLTALAVKQSLEQIVPPAAGPFRRRMSAAEIREVATQEDSAVNYVLSNFVKEMKWECSVCLTEYTDPRLLSCSHTFCKHCLAGLLGSESGKPGSIRCPECREYTKVPGKNIEKLPKNRYINEIRDCLEKLKLKKTAKKALTGKLHDFFPNPSKEPSAPPASLISFHEPTAQPSSDETLQQPTVVPRADILQEESAALLSDDTLQPVPADADAGNAQLATTTPADDTLQPQESASTSSDVRPKQSVKPAKMSGKKTLKVTKLKKAVLLSNQTLNLDRRSDKKTTTVRCIAISSAGVVVYCTVTKYTNRDWYSLYIEDHGNWQTVVFEAQDIITGLLFVKVGGRERLLMLDQPNIVIMDEQLTSSERTLIELRHDTPLCSVGNDKVWYVQRTDGCGWDHRGRAPCNWELWELKVKASEACQTTKLGHLQLGWKCVSDMCTTGDLLVLCSHRDKCIAAVGLDDWEVKWTVTEVQALNVAPGPKGTVFVACPDTDTIQQRSLSDGSLVPQDILRAISPWCLRNLDSTLYVVNYIPTSDTPSSANKNNWEIQQYKINPSGPWLLQRKIMNAFDDDDPEDIDYSCDIKQMNQEGNHEFSGPYNNTFRVDSSVEPIPLMKKKDLDPLVYKALHSSHSSSTNSHWVRRWLMRPERNRSSGMGRWSSANDGRGSDSRFK